MSIRAVAFDLDGLLVNTEEIYEMVGARLLQPWGHTLDERLLTRMIGRPSRVALPMMIEHYGLTATVAELEAATDVLFGEVLPEALQPMPGIADLLEQVERRGLPKILATSSRSTFAEQVLRLLEWTDRFEFRLTSESVAEGKPHPEIYQTAARRLQIQPAQLLVLEDSENGCRAAVAAGATTVAIPHRRTADHNFEGVHLIAQSAADPRIGQLLSD